MYEARKFNKQSYKDYDEYAKSTLSKFLINKGHSIVSSEEDYKHDIKTKLNGIDFLFEVEVKIGYPFTTKESYRFSSVSFLGRKERLHKINPFYYVILSKETGWAVMCHSRDIYKDEYIQNVNVNTNTRKGFDKLYRVPISKCKFFNCKNEDTSD